VRPPNPEPVPASSFRPILVAGRYELRAEIGRGGCAVIYHAKDHRLGRYVALKIVRASVKDGMAHARLAREARAAAAIHHPNVCAVTDAGHLDDGRPFIVMELLRGETLTSLVHRVGVLGAADAVEIALQLLSGLEAAHSIGVVHRDVKPDNIFLVPRTGCPPLVKLLDFGMCRRAATQAVEVKIKDDMTLTRAGQVVGTPEYMAPEQVRGKRAFDARIDLYASGVILYECLSGRRAFFGDDVREVVLSVLSKPLPSLRSIRPEVPLLLDRIVARAMEREASFRYRSAMEFQSDLLDAKAALLERQLRPERSSPSYSYETSLGAESDSFGEEWEMPTRQLPPPRRAVS
jgi:eukaryotic-like serine/threonine-protein kinase